MTTSRNSVWYTQCHGHTYIEQDISKYLLVAVTVISKEQWPLHILTAKGACPNYLWKNKHYYDIWGEGGEVLDIKPKLTLHIMP